MCIICISPKRVRQPSDSTLTTMFLRNPHGAGYMYARDGRVIIHKGFMDLDTFLSSVHREHFTARDSVVYHMRISTQAGVNPGMTHPFPLSNRLEDTRYLDLACDVGIAHNGIIELTSNPAEKRYSDTAIFIADYLSRIIKSPEDLRRKDILNMIYRLARSKFAIMDSTGYVAKVGEFINEKGLLFSNSTFLPTRPVR